MKILKAQSLTPNKEIFKISDLAITKHGFILEDILNGADMIDPIQVKKYTPSKTPRYGANGKVYRERVYGVWKGNQRVTAAVKLGYTHIEGIII